LRSESLRPVHLCRTWSRDSFSGTTQRNSGKHHGVGRAITHACSPIFELQLAATNPTARQPLTGANEL